MGWMWLSGCSHECRRSENSNREQRSLGFSWDALASARQEISLSPLLPVKSIPVKALGKNP